MAFCLSTTKPVSKPRCLFSSNPYKTILSTQWISWTKMFLFHKQIFFKLFSVTMKWGCFLQWVLPELLSWYPAFESSHCNSFHYSDVIMSMIASQITSLKIVYSTVYSDSDQRKHKSSMSLAFVGGIYWWPVNSPHKGPVTQKMFSVDVVIVWRSSTGTWSSNGLQCLDEHKWVPRY